MIPSILTSTKKALNLDPTYTVFDEDIILMINAVFGTLNQLGVGPEVGFQIEDSTKNWDSYLGGDPRQNDIKAYMFLRVRQLFDPPATSFLITAINDQIKELEWRINERREGTQWVDPFALENVSEVVEDHDAVLDGGTP
jgi:hypothetical protein